MQVDGQLAYLDFGLVSYVPQGVRDGLVRPNPAPTPTPCPNPSPTLALTLP